MAGTEVSSVIGDILDAFRNGFSIFKSSGRKHRRRQTEPSSSREENHLHDSLSKRPQQIKQAYDHSVAKHGRHFEIGDSTSQTTLAQVLLVLNTGLIRLLNHALSSDHKLRAESRSSLYSLSETTALDTLNALSQLNMRLASSSMVNLGVPSRSRKAIYHNKESARPKTRSSSQRPPISPRLKNGGWVRSKSDPSVVSVVTVNKPKKAEQTRASASRSPSAVTSATNLVPAKPQSTKSPPPRYSQLAAKPALVSKSNPEHLQAWSHEAHHAYKDEKHREVIRLPSMYIVPSDFFAMFPPPSEHSYEPQQISVDQSLPMRPPKIPFHSRPTQSAVTREEPRHAREIRPRPPSMMTFMTASTKIGEIPEHKLPERELTEEERANIPMPYVLPDMLAAPKRRGGRGLKFWKKDRQERTAVEAVSA